MVSVTRKTPLNIAMLSYHTCPLAILGGKDTGGMNVYVRELTRFLGQINVHVDVFTRSQDEHVVHVLHDLGYSNRVIHINAGPEVPLPRSELVRYIPDYYNGIRGFAKRKEIQYDLIHSHYWMSGIAAGMLKEEWHIPIIQMFHTLGYMKNKIARNSTEIEGPYRLIGEQKMMDLADKIIASTPAEVKQLSSHYQVDQQKITVIPPGVDCSHFYPIPKDEAKAFIGIPPDSRMILFVGRIEPLKGVETLLRAISIMRKDCNLEECPYHVVIIGGDSNEQLADPDSELFRLKSLCHDLGLDETVLFLGKRDQNTLPYYYSAAEMLVMPSYYESFGMVALESMACGTPVVASNIGGLVYLVQDGITGFTVSDRNDNALARRVSQLLFDQELQLKMGKQAAQYALSYSWEIIAAKMKRLYEELFLKTTG
jgi:D-inositol-3-phosphate glycosyltransferase